MPLIISSKRSLRPLSHLCRRRLSTYISHTKLATGGTAAHLSFTGPKKHPILDPNATNTLTEAIKATTSEPSTRVLFLRSTIAGADLNYMRELDSPQAARSFIRLIDKLCTTIQDAPVPVVAIIDGPCLGAGMEVAASCDFRIAVDAPHTVFGMPETRVGIPSVVQACLLPGLLGWGRAREVLYFGETFGVVQAERSGFVSEIVEEERLGSVIDEWELRVARTGDQALRAQKKLMRRWEERGVGREGVEAGIEAFAEAFEGQEPSKMMHAFFTRKR